MKATKAILYGMVVIDEFGEFVDQDDVWISGFDDENTQ